MVLKYISERNCGTRRGKTKSANLCEGSVVFEKTDIFGFDRNLLTYLYFAPDTGQGNSSVSEGEENVNFALPIEA